MKLRTRLLTGSALTIAAVVILLGLLFTERNADRRSGAQQVRLDTAQRKARELSLYVQYNAHDTNAYTLGHLEHKDEFDEHASAYNELVEDLDAEVRSGLLSGDVAQQLDTVRELRTRYTDASRALFAAADLKRTEPSAAHQAQEDQAWELADGLGDELDEASQALAASIGQQVQVLAAERESAYQRNAMLSGGVGLLLLLAIIVLQLQLLRAVGLPLKRLMQGVEQLARGEQHVRVDVRGQDEIAALAAGFNSMAETLEERVRSEAQAQQETQRLLKAEAENRQSLEESVRGLQGFVEKVAQGNLDELLPPQPHRSLQELGDNLNEMVWALQQARQESQELRQAEGASREQLEQAVGEYLAFVQRLSSGDLSSQLPARRAGALGALEQGLNRMAGSLHSLTTQVKSASANIAGVAGAILAASAQQAASAAEQSAAITQTTTTIEEVKAIAKQTDLQATQVAREIQQTLDVARAGTQSVEETTSGMEHIRQRVQGIAETILTLSEQTQAIGVIIQTVNELADQSNLLALNAAIEAARAGEQGKSFAVVAQHVRDLAERSKEATARIREILGEIQQTTNMAVMVTEEGTKGVEVGARLAGQSGQVFHRIALEVEHGAQANVQMAAAAQQQTSGMEQIGQAMQAIQQATNQALQSSRQAETAARDLNALAQSLQKTVEAYNV